jgi:hypothetical protein
MAKDHPFYEVAADAAIKMREGFTIHQKFTCARCGTRQIMAIPNVFYESGRCEECNHVTDIVARGCNYVAMVGVPTEH